MKRLILLRRVPFGAQRVRWNNTMSEIVAAVLGALGGGLLAYVIAVRNIHHTSVVQERKAWRDTMRYLTEQLALALDSKDPRKVEDLRRQMQMRLNPFDEQDHLILAAENAEELTGRVALLLKQDWERVKLEASLLGQLRQCPARPEYVTDKLRARPVFCEQGRDWKKPVEAAQRNVVQAARGFFWTMILALAPFFWRDIVLPLSRAWREASLFIWRYVVGA